jgi:hypothetical protein
MWQPTLEDALKYVFFASVYRATQMAMIRSKWGLDIVQLAAAQNLCRYARDSGLVSNLQIVGSQIVI